MHLKVLFLCNSPKVLAGVEKTALLLLDAIDSSQCEIRFILNGEGPFAEALKRRNADLEIIPCNKRLSLKWTLGLYHSLKKRPADVVQLHLSRLNAPLLHYCGAQVVERLNMNRHPSIKHPLKWQWLDRLTSGWIDAFILVSEALREEFLLRQYPASKMTVIHNGIYKPDVIDNSALREELGIAKNISIIGTMCRLTPQKGIETFINTAVLILEKRKDVHFVIAGDGELRKRLEEKVCALGFKDNITFIGFRNDPLQVIAGFDIMLYLSRWEPFANTILEAMVVGTPVIASDVGGNTEAITKEQCGGMLVEKDEPQKTAEAILLLLNNPDLVEKIIDSGTKRIKKYTVKAMAEKHTYVYSSVTGTG